MVQTDRDILFSNETFVIGMLQAVSGAGFVAAISQLQTLSNLFGKTAFLLVLTSMAVALMVAMLAAYCKHQYKLWDVKAQVSASKNESNEAQLRAMKANKYLKAMRIAFVVALIAILFGVAEVLVTVWIRDTAAAAQSPQDKQVDLTRVRSTPKVISVHSTSAEIFGRWSKVAGTGTSFVQAVNTVHVLCGKREGLCTESLAWIAVGKGETASTLEVDTLEYSILEWSATLIRATMAEPTGITFEIRIDPVRNVAERTVNVTDPPTAQGALGLRPRDSWRWSLQ